MLEELQDGGSRADLHVHSKYSDRPSDWFLRRIGAPESFVEPEHVYRTAKQRGMDFVTISDHNCIGGALEIAHHPDTFISCEVTAYFPEDRAKVHCLVSGIDEPQFAMIQELRPNIYEFRDYLVQQDIVYSLAHPLFRVVDRFQVEHLEKLLLLFNRFEGMNGTRDRRAGDLVNVIFRALTRDDIEAMADQHGIEPIGPEPWRKTFTGGSDDHSGLYVASAHTLTPPARSVREFVDHLRAGRHEMSGNHGTSMQLAHCFYQIGYSYYLDRFLEGRDGRATLLGRVFQTILSEGNGNGNGGGTLAPARPGNGLYRRVERFVRGRRLRSLSETERTILEELSDMFADPVAGELPLEPPALPLADGESDRPEWNDAGHAVFRIASRLSNTLGYSFVQKLVGNLQEGRVVDSLQTVASMGPVGLGLAPYLVSFVTQHKDEQFLRDVAERFPVARGYKLRSGKKAWLTDTLSDVNGVAVSIRRLAACAQADGRPLTVISSLSEPPRDCDFPVRNFKPVGEFSLPEYREQMLSFPPFLEMLEYLERERFSELIISTPGPVGLLGIAAARLLGLDTVGIYHTDFPAYVGHLTGDSFLVEVTRRYMQWFYDQCDTVFAPSHATLRQLAAEGLDPERMRVLGRGVDVELFRPERRAPDYWPQRGIDGFIFLYVGRVSKEKNLDELFSAFYQVLGRHPQARLAIVGDGPYLEELRRVHRTSSITFTGFQAGERLASAYASADAFVFPSTTDTFGNVVLEAQASGLPVVVTSKGGPADTVRSTDSGLIVEPTADALAEAMGALIEEPDLASRLSYKGLANARECRWEAVLEDLWAARAPRRGATERVPRERRPAAMAAVSVARA